MTNQIMKPSIAYVPVAVVPNYIFMLKRNNTGISSIIIFGSVSLGFKAPNVH